MSAYLLAQLAIHDKDKFEIYRQMVPATLTPFGGRFIVRGGKVETLEATWSPQRLVILEFPSSDKAKAWLNSPEYAEARRLRHESAHSEIIVVDGI
jgi:uncharacterized protein (DUF1330 family)